MTDPKPVSRRIEFKTRTEAQKTLFESMAPTLGFQSLSEMARHALEQLIEQTDMASPEVIRLQRQLQERDERILELESSLTKRDNAYQYLRSENEELRIHNYGSITGLDAILMSRQIDAFIRNQNGVSRQAILSAIERPFEIQGLAEFLTAYIEYLFEEGCIIQMHNEGREVLMWIK
jgi:hypothetical protein